MTDLIQILTAADSADLAARIAESLVSQRLAACVQVQGPVHSTYRWKGAVEQATEWLVIAKTSQGRFAAVAEAICKLHSYEVPEIIAVPILEGSSSYLDWLREQVNSP